MWAGVADGAEVQACHRIYTDERLSVEDVAYSLLAAARSIRETPDFLCELMPGLRIDRIDLSIEEAEKGSLREVFWGIVFVTFQEQLTQEVPDLIHQLFGYDVPDNADTIVTAASVIIVFYTAEFIYKRIFDREPVNIRRQLDGLVEDVAKRMRVPEESVRKALSAKYDHNRLRSMASMVTAFFRPGKGDASHPMRVGPYEIDMEVVAEIPGAIDEDRLQKRKNLIVYHTKVDVVAEDLHSPNKWAAVVEEISPLRRPLRVIKPVMPEDIYTRRYIIGDVVAVMETGVCGELYPLEYHPTRVDS